MTKSSFISSVPVPKNFPPPPQTRPIKKWETNYNIPDFSFNNSFNPEQPPKELTRKHQPLKAPSLSTNTTSTSSSTYTDGNAADKSPHLPPPPGNSRTILKRSHSQDHNPTEVKEKMIPKKVTVTHLPAITSESTSDIIENSLIEWVKYKPSKPRPESTSLFTRNATTTSYYSTDSDIQKTDEELSQNPYNSQSSIHVMGNQPRKSQPPLNNTFNIVI